MLEMFSCLHVCVESFTKFVSQEPEEDTENEPHYKLWYEHVRSSTKQNWISLLCHQIMEHITHESPSQ